MVFIIPNGTNINIIALLESSHYLYHLLFYFPYEHRPTIFYRYLDVVITFRDIMMPIPQIFRYLYHLIKVRIYPVLPMAIQPCAKSTGISCRSLKIMPLSLDRVLKFQKKRKKENYKQITKCNGS